MDFDWEEFLNNNQQIMSLLTEAALLGEDIIKNCAIAEEGIAEFNSLMNHLRETSINSSKVDTTDIAALSNHALQLEDYLSTYASLIIGELPKLEYNISIFNKNGVSSDLEGNNLFTSFGQGVEEAMPFLSVCAEIWKETGSPLGFLLYYGIDLHEGGTNSVHDIGESAVKGTKMAWTKICEKSSGKLASWAKGAVDSNKWYFATATVGTVAVFLASFYSRYKEDEGEYTFANFATNTLGAIGDTGAFAAGTAFSWAIGGIPGILVGAVGGEIIQSFNDLVVNGFTGNYEADTFYIVQTKNGLEFICDHDYEIERIIERYGEGNIAYYNCYEVPRNLYNADKSFDVILEYQRERINGK